MDYNVSFIAHMFPNIYIYIQQSWMMETKYGLNLPSLLPKVETW